MGMRSLSNEAARRHRTCEPNISANYRARADGYSAEDSCARVNDYIVLNDRVARQPLCETAIIGRREAFCSQGDVLVNPDTLADYCGLANDNTGTVVDKEAGANGGARMDVYASLTVSQFGNHTRYERHTEREQTIGDTVTDSGADAWVAEQHLVNVASSGVTAPSGQYILIKGLTQSRQLPRERSGKVERTHLELGISNSATVSSVMFELK